VKNQITIPYAVDVAHNVALNEAWSEVSEKSYLAQLWNFEISLAHHWPIEDGGSDLSSTVLQRIWRSCGDAGYLHANFEGPHHRTPAGEPQKRPATRSDDACSVRDVSKYLARLRSFIIAWHFSFVTTKITNLYSMGGHWREHTEYSLEEIGVRTVEPGASNRETLYYESECPRD
jgi:hypothetical protein